jgi:hypothetical protein
MKAVKDKSDMSGIYGEKVATYKDNGRVIIKNRPVRKMSDPTEKQVVVQDKFLQAAQYAATQMANPEAKALYKARVGGKIRSAFAAAVADFLNPPKVQSINTDNYLGTIGNSIVISVVDILMVTKVKVVISNASGAVIEQGEAVKDLRGNSQYEYTTTVSNPTLAGTKIRAIAFDFPGHSGFTETVLS